ncbi:MAG: AsmA family protein [Methyloligellaceae bacterium]
MTFLILRHFLNIWTGLERVHWAAWGVRNGMEYLTRIRIGQLAAICLVLLAIGYLIARPVIPNERSIRNAVIQHLTEWTGATVSITGRMRFSYFPRPGVVIPKVRLMGIQRLPALREIHTKRIDVRLGLWSLISGAAVVDRITLIEPQIDSISGGGAAARRSIPNTAQTLVQALNTAPLRQIRVENGVLTVAGPTTSEHFKDVNAKINLDGSGGAHSSRGTFSWRGQTVTFRYEGGGPEQAANTVKIPVTATIGGDLFSADIEGEALITDDLWVKGNLDLAIANLPRFARWTGVLVPDDQKTGDFSATGSFHWEGHRIGFDEGSFTLDGNRALGAMMLDFGTPRPQIEGTFALQKLNLAQYIQTSALLPATSTPDAKPGKQKSTDVDFPLLHHFNLDVRISTTELTAPPVTVGQSALSVTLKSGRLAADIAIFDMCGGTGNARLEFDASVPDSAIRLTANIIGVSTQSCIEIFTPDSHMKGTANVTAEVTSKGRTATEIFDTLGGKITLSMTAGQADVDVPKLVSSLRNGPVKGWNAARGNATAFETLKGEFFLRHGGAYTDSLKINLGTTNLTGEGTIDLAAGGLDMRMRMIGHPPKDAPAGTKAKKPADGLTGEIVIKGPWSEPSFTLEPAKKSASVTSSDRARTAQRGDF